MFYTILSGVPENHYRNLEYLADVALKNISTGPPLQSSWCCSCGTRAQVTAFTTSRNFFSKSSLAEWCPYTRRLRLAQTSGPALGQVVSQGQVPSVPFWAAALKRSEYHSRVVSYTTLDIFEIDTSTRICYDACC